MKYSIKVFGILLIGLFVAVFCYPFLHESGHVIAIVLCGAKLQEFHILPIPYVLCNTYMIGNIQQSLIGLTGMVFPLIISMFIRTKHFWLWLISFMIKGISALAFVLSYIAILCYDSGMIWVNEDIVKVVEISGIHRSVWMVILLFLFYITFTVIYKNKPLIRIKNFFQI